MHAWDFTIITDRTIRAFVQIDLNLDFSCPFDDNVCHKEIEKVDKYQDLLLELRECGM